ncbi:RNA polymerase sigma factor [Polluticoccus soli]|uniref:RNA polymerase sigma factor n=1 Tax=Polluticoccus soli TaxID=3034150 RepID=UPI0023E1D7E5|nr:sigma-70 family RNA polymerase sigma factor [Flavipsychrobacter sp. JY13-12]
MNDTVNELQLTEACCKQDPMAQKRLYDLHVDAMMIICYRYVPNREDAKEVMLDGFYNVFKNIGSFQYIGDGSLKAWMRKIMVNQCLMYLRKRKMVFADADTVNDETAGGDDTIGRLSAKEIIRLIHTLPDGYRTVFNLHVFEEKNHKEISLLLGISESTSKTQLHKAKKLLQKKILENV